MSRALAFLFLACDLAGCARGRPVFDEIRAFRDLQTQVGFGPRIPGEVTHAHCLAWLDSQLHGLADSVWRQSFVGTLPGDRDSVAMTNVIARFGRGNRDRILLSAHWDTRPFADFDPDSANWRKPVPGANDGASGVAVLLELARAFDSIPPPVGVDIVLFDGEDAGLYRDNPGQWCQGSFHFAANLPARYKWAMNIDMVGDKDLSLPIEGHSFRLAPDLARRIWERAAKLGEIAFQSVRGADIFDDHMPLSMKGINAIDIIDLDYRWWHTTHDTPDKCAPASLGAVGRVLLSVIYDD